MILGLDLYGTITAHPITIRALIYALKDGGWEVHVISAVKTGNKQKAIRDALKYNLEINSIVVVEYDNYHQVPKLKYQAALELGVKLFVDDRKDTIQYFNKRNIMGLLLTK